jgi:hypothetical protein
VALIGAFRLEGNRALFDQSLDLLTRDAPALAGASRTFPRATRRPSA